MTPDQHQFWDAFCAATGQTGAPSAVIGFGNSPQMQDDLAQLVLTGPKRATASALWEYTAEDDPVPTEGDRVMFLWSSGQPAGIWQTTEIRIGPLSSVDDAFAWDEGEGDRSRDWWLTAHIAFFEAECARLGRVFNKDDATVFERFRLVWPPEHADG